MAILLVILVIGVAYLALAGGSSAAAADTGNMGAGDGGIMDGGGGMRLTADQISTYAANAGFTGNDLQAAVAVALAESSGQTDALGDPTLGVSVGLWQINLRAHPEYSQDELMNPQTNASAAYAIYHAAGRSFKPWTTFKTAAYLAYMPSGGEVGV